MIDTRDGPDGLFVLASRSASCSSPDPARNMPSSTMPGFEGFLGRGCLPAGFRRPIVLAEFVGGVALVLGLYSRWVAAALVRAPAPAP